MAPSETGSRSLTSESEEDTEENPPEIEEDLIQEELRIDGICGVY